jgi:hypothetical protein
LTWVVAWELALNVVVALGCVLGTKLSFYEEMKVVAFAELGGSSTHSLA